MVDDMFWYQITTSDNNSIWWVLYYEYEYEYEYEYYTTTARSRDVRAPTDSPTFLMGTCRVRTHRYAASIGGKFNHNSCHRENRKFEKHHGLVPDQSSRVGFMRHLFCDAFCDRSGGMGRMEIFRKLVYCLWIYGVVVYFGFYSYACCY